MLLVPTQPIPNQTLQVSLAQQQVGIALRQTDYGLFMDVTSNGVPIANGVLCEYANLIVRAAYTGFIGDFAWNDTSGAGANPIYTGLGDQFQLIYLEASDL